ncbi:hypothetical protein MHU86_13822 [Fragilaria crotonensis]|nr:hypothetical protein MHU86_13822 [Fragilaria crotonensis]
MASPDTLSPALSSFEFPTVSPVTMPPSPGYVPCSICGEGMSVGFLDLALEFPGYPILSCKALQTAGLDGYVSPDYCPILTTLVFDACKCIEAPVTTSPTPSPTTSAVRDPSSPTLKIILALFVLTQWMM